MRSAFFVSLFLMASSVYSTPVPVPAPAPAPAPRHLNMFSSDPYSIHRRDVSLPFEERTPEAEAEPEPEAEPEAATVADDGLSTDVTVAGHPCYSACKIQKVEGVRTEQEALCSVDGLKATRDCARCIDVTWPDGSWEDSAMAEYERIVSSCENM